MFLFFTSSLLNFQRSSTNTTQMLSNKGNANEYEIERERERKKKRNNFKMQQQCRTFQNYTMEGRSHNKLFHVLGIECTRASVYVRIAYIYSFIYDMHT